MAVHYHLVCSMVDSLNEVFELGKYADKVIEKTFKANRKWGARDRRFFAETMYEIVRHRRRLEYISEQEDAWSLVGAHLIATSGELPDWEEFAHIDFNQIKKRASQKPAPQVQHSFPDWLHKLGLEEFGDEWIPLMAALNTPAEVFLRVNLLKTTPDHVIEELAREEIIAEHVKKEGFDLSQCLKLKQRKNVFITEAFRKGYFEVQDAASQLVAPLLKIQPGLRVADACAGAGGKTLHIASLMKNKGKIISMDIHEWKLKELRTRAARDGVDIVETKLIDSSKIFKRLENSFDRVLLDVPCSGMGVLRRNPDTKWKLSMEEIERLTVLQREIISDYSKMCKVGGVMVYATCSILRRENEDQVKWFLESEAGKTWSLQSQMRVWPHKDGFDGFFAAVLERKP